MRHYFCSFRCLKIRKSCCEYNNKKKHNSQVQVSWIWLIRNFKPNYIHNTSSHKSKEKGPVSSLSKILYQGLPIFLERELLPYYKWALLAWSSFSPVDMLVLYFSYSAYRPILCSSQVLIASVSETAFDFLSLYFCWKFFQIFLYSIIYGF